MAVTNVWQDRLHLCGGPEQHKVRYRKWMDFYKSIVFKFCDQHFSNGAGISMLEPRRLRGIKTNKKSPMTHLRI